MVQVAKFLGTRHFSFEFTVQQGLDVLNDVIYHLETFDVTTGRTNHEDQSQRGVWSRDPVPPF